MFERNAIFANFLNDKRNKDVTLALYVNLGDIDISVAKCTIEENKCNISSLCALLVVVYTSYL